jgi:hypothetical protein
VSVPNKSLLLRFNADGTLDDSFGTGGTVQLFPMTDGRQPDHA